MTLKQKGVLMAISQPKSGFEARRYQEPEQSQLVRRPLAGRLGRTMLRDVNKRTMAIDSDMEILEPLQDGVLRYPPVQVQVPRNVEYINQYLDMKPIDSKKPGL